MPPGAEFLGFLASPGWGDLVARHWTEVFGFITGVACVGLLVRQNIWNWPVGIANNLTFIVLYYRHGLYADVGLQVFYVVISLYGWWAWLHGGRDHGRLAVSRVKPPVALGLAAVVALATVLMATALKRGLSDSWRQVSDLKTKELLDRRYERLQSYGRYSDTKAAA